MRSYLPAVALAVLIGAACDAGSGGSDASAGAGAGGRAGNGGVAGGGAFAGGTGGVGGAAGGSGACSEIAYTQMIYSPGGALGGMGGGAGSGHVSIISQCRSFPPQCANDRHCSCVCPSGVPCYNGLGCACSESNGVVAMMCWSD